MWYDSSVIMEQHPQAGPVSMFRGFAQSAKSVLEESFIMITETHIIEMKSSKLNLSIGTVTFAIPIELMAKLKFRRQESISLFFKTAPNDPLIYMCPDSADAVHQIQSVLKKHGVKGKAHECRSPQGYRRGIAARSGNSNQGIGATA